VKRIPVPYHFFVLIGPLLVIAALMAGPFGCGGGGGSTATPVVPMGSLEVGFVDSPSNAFQAIALNIIAVRLNPSTNASVSDLDPNWQTVTVPPGSAPGELSVNLLDFQNDATVFNIGQIPSQVYNQVEVVVDGNLPGMVISSCGSGIQEGCVTANAAFSGSTNLRTTVPGGINVAQGGLTPLIIDINPGTPGFPSAPGGKYTLNPTISVVSNVFLGTIRGAVTGLQTLSNDTINAEVTGTNAVIASAPVTGGNYTIALPAAVDGTNYDLFVTGSTTYSVAASIPLTRGGSAVRNFNVTTNSGTTITGTVIDERTGNGLVGATVNLLLPEASSLNCITGSFGCVVVNTTTSDSAGNYTFSAIQPPPSGTPYYVQASTTGTDTVTQQLSYSSTPTCFGSPNHSNCSFELTNFAIGGTVVVDPPPASGTNTLVTILAEQTGTGNLVGLTQATVGPSGSSAFGMEVPTKVGNVDLIASAQDAYLGVGTQYSGHQLAVASNINPSTPPPVTLTVTCLGHGTIAGVANLSDSGTHVRLYQNNVQLMDTTVGSTVPIPGSTAAPPYPNQYSFCVPPSSPGNNYTIQRFEVTGGVPSPIGTPQTVVVPVPTPFATSSACPVCANTSGMCPGNCTATTANPL
jgi:hypothetical protein